MSTARRADFFRFKKRHGLGLGSGRCAIIVWCPFTLFGPGAMRESLAKRLTPSITLGWARSLPSMLTTTSSGSFLRSGNLEAEILDDLNVPEMLETQEEGGPPAMYDYAGQAA